MTVTYREEDPPFVASAYFLKAYGAASLSRDGSRWVTVVDSEGLWQLPLVLEPIEGGGYESHSPYGYTGIFASTELSRPKINDHWQDSLEVLRELGVVSTFLRFAPFDLRSVEQVKGMPGLNLTHASDTVLVPTPDPTSIWNGMHGNSRTAVRKAERLGMVGTVEPATPYLLSAGSPFRTLYEATMLRVEAASHHFYNDDYYSALLEGLGPRLQHVSVRNEAGDVAASALILVDRDIAHYHLSGSNPLEARNGANNLLLWTLLQWSAANGLSSAHLGGGTSRGDSLYKFKASFGGHALPFYIGKTVVNDTRYDQLTRMHAARIGIDVNALSNSGYFPAFRALGNSNA